MHRFFESIENLEDNKIKISSENLHHINVLRIEEDEDVEIVVDGEIYISKIEFINKKEAFGKIINKMKSDSESNIKINLYQGIPKSDKLELIIQKSVELGVFKIIPFESSRSIVKWDKKKESKKLERYREIAESASKQSKRTLIPKVCELISFNQLIEDIKEKYTILAYENRGVSLKTVIQENTGDSFNIIIGPEGGFSESEVLKLEESGAKVVNLGKRILRTETAAIALISMIQYEAGDINLKS